MEGFKKRGIGTIAWRLFLICATVAGVVSFVYSLTAAQYEKNLTEERRLAIVRIFGNESVTFERREAEDAVLYTVSDADRTLGYCVEVVSAGFGGDLSLMVGFDAAREIVGVAVVSHSETPGLGSLAAEPDFLSQFAGKGGELTLGEDVDAISGATVSSRAVLDGVNLAAARLEAMLQMGGEGK